MTIQEVIDGIDINKSHSHTPHWAAIATEMDISDMFWSDDKLLFIL